jgi:hypothetical protein
MSNRDREDLREAGQDAALERAWRGGSAEQPLARLDAAILAAAHKAVADRNRIPAATPARVPPRQRWSRWAPMAAAAAVAGLAFMLVQTLPRDPERAPAPAAQESAKAAAPASAPTPAPAPPASAERPSVTAPRSSRTVGTAAPEQDSAQGLAAAPAAAPAPPAARNQAAEAAVADQVAVVDEWVQRITALHAAGDIAAAENALRAFRAAVPDADRHLPESLKEWAALVR